MKVGIIGGGQLARMMALEGYPLGLSFLFLDPKEDACAGQVGELLCAEYDDENALDQMAEAVDVATFDFENVPVDAARYLAAKIPVFPAPDALGVAQDRLSEKQLFQHLGIPVPEYYRVDSEADLMSAVDALGGKAVVKTRRLGYDGKGQRIAEGSDGARAVWNSLGDVPLIAEALVPFKREVSVIAVRGADGTMLTYPLTENRHRNGILATSFAPATGDEVARQADDYTRRVLNEFSYVGVMAIEFFDLGDHVQANEMAPRVHNSGHWTLNGADTSQFENHLRAVLGWPLGGATALGSSAMINWIGAMPDPARALRCDNTHWHDYGKTARPGRKVGHVNLWGPNMAELQLTLGRFAVSLGEQVSAGVEGFLLGDRH